ncbi:MAG: hypothetical protein ACI4Q7_00235 [Candidatus Avelusimicrobium sp.]
MATDLAGNETLQKFIALLADLNHECADMFATGKIEILHKMNKTVRDMYAIQHTGTEEAYTAIEEDAQAIYKNFNAIVAMLKSNESGSFDKATNVAVKKFLQNIFDANVRILTAYGLT